MQAPVLWRIAALPLLLGLAAGQSVTCVPLSNQGGGAFYTAHLNVGTPAQEMHVVADTGSYDLLLDSTFCDQQACRLHTQFDALSSSTSVNPTGNEYITLETTAYGQGSVESAVWQDTVRLGSLSASGVDMLLMVNSQLEGYDDPADAFDGIMGLGRQNTTATELNQVALLSAISVDDFSMCLGSMDLTGENLGGRLELGTGPLYNSIQGDLVQATTAGHNSWCVHLTAATVGNDTVAESLDLGTACEIGSAGGCATLVDSGTTLLTFPSQLYTGLIDAIEAQCPGCLTALEQEETCSGTNFEQLPNINFTLGGVEVSLIPDIYMASMEVVLGGILRVGPFYYPYSTPGVRCMPLFSVLDEVTNAGPLTILGMPFLRAYGTYFNRQDGVMSFSKLGTRRGTVSCDTCPSAEYPGRARMPLAGPGHQRRGSHGVHGAHGGAHAGAAHVPGSASNHEEHRVLQPFKPHLEQDESLDEHLAEEQRGRRSTQSAAALAADAELVRSGRGREAAAEAAEAAAAAPPRPRPLHLRVSSIRWPWWAVDPAARPGNVRGSAHARGHNASAVSALETGRSTWRLTV